VYLIRDGTAAGLLVGRKAASASAARYEYYWNDGSTKHKGQMRGLDPDHHPSLQALCAGRTYGIQSAEEQAFLDVVGGCADWFEAAGQPGGDIPNDKVPREYWAALRVLDRLRNPTSRIRRFFVDKTTFMAHVLQGDRKKPFLTVKAQGFGVLAPHEVMPQDGLDYLQHVTELLKMRLEQSPSARSGLADHSPGIEASYFRREGPLAVDLDAETVFRRVTVLADLRDLVLGAPFCALIGAAGTGKTVLVRQLAHQLYSNGYPRVYCFPHHRSFDIDRLARIINGIRGIVIIEDVHYDMESLQHLFSRLRYQRHRHVLFTSRVPLCDSNVAQLSAIPAVTLSCHDVAGDIIHWYIQSHPSSIWTASTVEDLSRQCSSNLWVLAHALEGCVIEQGRGSVTHWLRQAALRDMASLDECGDVYANDYPTIVVALSALYARQGSMTAEAFLRDTLRVPVEALRSLLGRGSIRCERRDHYGLLYGLHHPSLADAYWEFGRQYLGDAVPRDRDEFVKQYVLYRPPNGLAVLNRTQAIGSGLVQDLSRSGHLVDVVRAERVLGAVTEFLRTHGTVSPGDSLISVVVAKANDAERLDEIGACLRELSRRLTARECRAVREGIDQARLADKANHEAGGETIAWFIVDVCEALGGEFVELLDLTHIAKACEHVGCRTLIYMLSALKGAHAGVWQKLVGLFSIPVLAGRLREITSASQMLYLLSEMFAADVTSGRALWTAVGKKAVVACAEAGIRYELAETMAGIGQLFRASDEYAMEVWTSVCSSVARRLERKQSHEDGSAAWTIRQASQTAWHQLLECCGRADLAQRADEFGKEVEWDATHDSWGADDL
jgi:hypothetical protein